MNDLLTAIRKEDIIEVIELLKDKSLNVARNDNEAFISACSSNNLELVKLFLNDNRVDPSARDNDALISACESKNLEMVKLLLTHDKVDVSARDNNPFVIACWNGSFEMAKFFLKDPKVDPSAQDNQALIYACDSGHIEIVKLLLNNEKVNVADQDNKALINSCKNGHLEIVKLLLNFEQVDPSAQKNIASVWTQARKNNKLLDLLFKDSRVRETLEDSNPNIFKVAMQRRIANSLSGFGDEAEPVATYTVKQYEDIQDVSFKLLSDLKIEGTQFNTEKSIVALRELNGLGEGEAIKAGMVLKLPTVDQINEVKLVEAVKVENNGVEVKNTNKPKM